MELYIIRHGDPDYANDTLTERGWEEARLLAPRMVALNPTRIYASPRGRAQDTARPTCEALGMEFQIEDWMTEKMEYMRSFDYTNEELYDSGYTITVEDGPVLTKDYSPDRTADLDEMIKNSDAFLLRQGYKREGYRYKAVKPNDDVVLCFCHGGFGGCWVWWLLGNYPIFAWQHFTMSTAAVTKFVFKEDESGYLIPRASYIGDRSHKYMK